MIALLLGVFFIWLILFVIFAVIGAIVKISLKLIFGFPILGAVVFLLIAVCFII